MKTRRPYPRTPPVVPPRVCVTRALPQGAMVGRPRDRNPLEEGGGGGGGLSLMPKRRNELRPPVLSKLEILFV